MIFDVRFFYFILTPYSFPTIPVKHTMFYTDLLRIAQPLIWYDLFLHRVLLIKVSVKFLFCSV